MMLLAVIESVNKMFNACTDQITAPICVLTEHVCLNRLTLTCFEIKLNTLFIASAPTHIKILLFDQSKDIYPVYFAVNTLLTNRFYCYSCCYSDTGRIIITHVRNQMGLPLRSQTYNRSYHHTEMFIVGICAISFLSTLTNIKINLCESVINSFNISTSLLHYQGHLRLALKVDINC